MANPAEGGPYIRLYRPNADDAAIVHIFRETADVGLKTEPSWTIASYLWARPYIYLSPETCFVLDDGNGTPVGYCIGTPNTEKFVDAWKEAYLPTLDRQQLPPPQAGDPTPSWEHDRPRALLRSLYDPYLLMNGQIAALWHLYPGHLHIDILPAWHRKGWGRKLIDTLLQKLREEGCSAVHLGMVGTNHTADQFYKSLKFKRHPNTLDGGASGEKGRTREDTIIQVKDLVDD